MSWLLDTHVVLWWLLDDPTLSDELKERIENDAEVFLSAATVWEMSIKMAAGKLNAPDDVAETLAGSGLIHLPITIDHAIAAGRLPLIHRDHFDRMLVAQARREGLTLVTRDPEIKRYDVEIMAA